MAPYTVGLLRRVPDGVVAQVSESYTEWKQKEEGSVESLHPKPWEASWLSVTFPLARGGPTDPASPALFKLGAVNEQFAMPYGGAGTRHGVRHGRLFELLDAFTGEIAMRHTNHTNPARPLTLVTAGADSMESLSELDATADFTLTGAVTRVGRSSLEVTAEVRQHNSLALTSRFHYVARDATTYGAAEINPLQLDPTTDPEAVARAADAARRAKGRRDRAEASLYHSPPTAAESKLIHTRHSEWVQYADISSHRVQMPEPLRSVNVMQMDNRNIHGKIFGGYLLRKAYEAAWSSAVELLASKNGSAETVQYMAAVQLSRVSEVCQFACTQHSASPRRPDVLPLCRAMPVAVAAPTQRAVYTSPSNANHRPQNTGLAALA